MQVKRTVETIRDFPGLGQKIKEIRQQDKRSLGEICKECGISRAYWYQIEAEDLRASVTEDVVRRIEFALGTDLGVEL